MPMALVKIIYIYFSVKHKVLPSNSPTEKHKSDIFWYSFYTIESASVYNTPGSLQSLLFCAILYYTHLATAPLSFFSPLILSSSPSLTLSFLPLLLAHKFQKLFKVDKNARKIPSILDVCIWTLKFSWKYDKFLKNTIYLPWLVEYSPLHCEVVC